MRRIIMLLGIIALIAGCATVTLNGDESAIIQGAGYTASFLVCQNNPNLIPEVEAAVNRAVTMADSPTVNLSMLFKDIQSYASSMQTQYPKEARLVYPVIYQLQLMGSVDLALPEEAGKVLPKLKVLLKGIQDGIRDAKGVKS